MYSFNLLLVLVAAATSIQAFRFSDVYTPADILNLRETSKSRRNVLPATCPAVWTKVSGVLTKKFRDTSTGQCNDAARAAIRAAFHDCGSWNTTSTGGCDGSLFLAGEYTRTENLGLQTIAVYLGNLAKQFNVGVADMFQFAASQAIIICPLGPRVVTFVGRKDSSVPNPEGLLPDPHADGNSLVKLFLEKTITPAELAALIGAHTTSRQFFVDTAEAGEPQDTTDGVWDVTYYQETLANTAPFRFPSDINIANHAAAGPVFKSFENNQPGWNIAFAAAMNKLSLLGVPASTNLIDCTSALPPQKIKRVRDIKSAPILRTA